MSLMAQLEHYTTRFAAGEMVTLEEMLAARAFLSANRHNEEFMDDAEQKGFSVKLRAAM